MSDLRIKPIPFEQLVVYHGEYGYRATINGRSFGIHSVDTVGSLLQYTEDLSIHKQDLEEFEKSLTNKK